MILRNRNRHGNYADYQPSMPQPQASPNILDPQNERLLDLAEQVGQLGAQNDLINEDNQRLEQENKDLRDQLRTTKERNIELERREAAGKAAYDTTSEIISAVKSSLKEKK